MQNMYLAIYLSIYFIPQYKVQISFTSTPRFWPLEPIKFTYIFKFLKLDTAHTFGAYLDVGGGHESPWTCKN